MSSILIKFIFYIRFLTIFFGGFLRIFEKDLKNFAKHNSGLTIPLVIILFSMAGIPPLAGFFGKLYLLLNAFEEKLYFLVFVGLLTSIISAYYYLKLVKLLVIFHSCFNIL